MRCCLFLGSGKYRSPDNRWPVDSTFVEVEKDTGKPLGLMGIVGNISLISSSIHVQDGLAIICRRKALHRLPAR